MFALKSCPRCNGDLYLTSDGDPACLQCGYDPGPYSRAPAIRHPIISDPHGGSAERRARSPSAPGGRLARGSVHVR